MEYIVNKYKELLIQENKKHNLVSRRMDVEELDEHIRDSLAILDWVNLSGRGVDIGTGAGFPGLILAIYCPDIAFTLIEADLKKSMFLTKVGRECNLSNVQVVRKRAEEAGRDLELRERFDFCTSRAVAAMRVMLEYALPLVKKGGLVYMWKGPNFEEEWKEAHNALEVLGGRVVDVYAYASGDRRRYIVAVEKTAPTPEKYPRRTGIPAKRPL
ncbi:16S rRNA (guanine(527)-N(7))-methyltransferase RsmG [Thermosyntropha lipolytica]|nr:16S rRNA (guanine(527)-N(7))-methyltransferase RsmG [Thermosyntropha lipolytica]